MQRVSKSSFGKFCQGQVEGKTTLYGRNTTKGYQRSVWSEGSWWRVRSNLREEGSVRGNWKRFLYRFQGVPICMNIGYLPQPLGTHCARWRKPLQCRDWQVSGRPSRPRPTRVFSMKESVRVLRVQVAGDVFQQKAWKHPEPCCVGFMSVLKRRTYSCCCLSQCSSRMLDHQSNGERCKALQRL